MKSVLGAVAASCFVAVAILLLSWTIYFVELNSSAYDFALRLAGPVPPSSPVVIVAIDEDSLGRIGMWPWSRDKLARLIQGVSAGKPRAIALDLLLDNETSEDGDHALALAIANAPPMVLATRRDSVDGVERWRQPLGIFVQKGVLLGHVHAEPDFDGISRQVFSLKAGEGRVVPAFAVQALHAAGLEFKSDFEQKAGGAQLIRPQAINIRFAGDQNTFRRVPAWRVLEGSADAGEFKDQIILIGFTAEGLGDEWFTPFAIGQKKTSGVEVHANVIDTLYAGRVITEVHALALLAALGAFVLLLWWLNHRFEGWRFYVAAISTGPLLLALSWLFMKYFHEKPGKRQQQRTSRNCRHVEAPSFESMIQPPQQENKCAKRRQQSQCVDFCNYPSCIKRVDHVRMHFDTARLLLSNRKWREPFVSKTFCGKTNQDNLVFELSRIGAAFENSPCGDAAERVLVTSESNVYGLPGA